MIFEICLAAAMVLGVLFYTRQRSHREVADEPDSDYRLAVNNDLEKFYRSFEREGINSSTTQADLRTSIKALVDFREKHPEVVDTESLIADFIKLVRK